MFYGFVVAGAWLIWHLLFGIKVVGRENIPRDGSSFVIAPNHISGMDPVLVIISRFWGRKLVTLAKDELMHIHPFFTWFFRKVGVVSIQRGKGQNDVLDEAIRQMKEEGRGMLIFPEGTRSKTGEPGRIKSGAFVVASAAHADMIPCRIIYRHGTMRLFSRVRICFGKPIPAEKLDLGEVRSAAKLRECKQMLSDAWQQLYDENKF